MKRNSLEFEELTKNFESNIKSMSIYIAAEIKREKDKIEDQYYTNDIVNKMFISFMYGYQYAKCLARLDSLTLEE